MESTPVIQWYPGHIAKLERQLQALLKQLDVVVELVDGRIPLTSRHNILSQKIQLTKPVLLLLNKSDLADPYWTTQWVTRLKDETAAILVTESLSGKGKTAVLQGIARLGEPQMLKQEAKGLKRRPIRVGVVGMPNVGKSSFINALIGYKKAQTGHRAGITRSTQWIRIHPSIELMDTPGIIPPILDSEEAGQLLASVYSVGENAFDEIAIAAFLLDRIESLYPGALVAVYGLPAAEAPTLEAIARKRLFLLPGDLLDLKRTAQAILKDFRLGRLGRFTLEHCATRV